MRIKKLVPVKNFSHILKHVVAHFGAKIGVGAIIGVPVLIVYYVIKWLFENSDNLFQSLIDVIPIADKIFGIGFVLLLILLYSLGLIYKNVFGKKLVHFFQQLGLKTPLIRNIYKPAKGFTETFAGETLHQARVVGTYLYGEFVLGLYASSIIKDGVKCVNFYYITSPTPNSGLVFIIPETKVYEILVEKAQDTKPVPLTASALMESCLACRPAELPSVLTPMSVVALMEHCISCGTSSPVRIVTRPLAYSEY